MHVFQYYYTVYVFIIIDDYCIYNIKYVDQTPTELTCNLQLLYIEIYCILYIVYCIFIFVHCMTLTITKMSRNISVFVGMQHCVTDTALLMKLI